MAPLPDTFFTAPAHWRGLVVAYFFLGGIAGGSFVLAALVDLFGRGEDERRLVRPGYGASLAALLSCPPLLILDLDRPERFWHLFWMSERGGFMVKSWSPISIGSWGLLAFSAFAGVATLAVLGDGATGRAVPLLTPLARLRRGLAGKVLAVCGGGLGFFVAGYTGVLLSVTNRPIWGDTTLLGALFLLSATATSAALLSLLLRWRGAGEGSAQRWLAGVEARVAGLELLALFALVLSLGPVARVWLGVWGVALLGAVLLSAILPLALHARPALLGRATAPAAASLVLAGGLALRAVLVYASEAIG